MKKLNDMVETDFLELGYKKFLQEYKSCDYFYQKKFIDKIGVKYFIEILVYNEYKHKFSNMDFKQSFSVICAFQNSEPYTVVEYHFCNGYTIEEIEELVEKQWDHINKPYYDIYENKTEY